MARHTVSAAGSEAFDALVTESLPTVRSILAAWRTGLTGVVTLVTTGIIPKGRTDMTTLTLPRRIAVTLAIGAGLALAIVRLWHTLAAEVGARTRLRTLDDIRGQYASVQAAAGRPPAPWSPQPSGLTRRRFTSVIFAPPRVRC